MTIWLPILLVVLVFSCARKTTGRRSDLALVVVMLSAVLIAMQLQPQG